MGIKPTSGDPVVIPPDNTQSRWGEWEAELDDKGEVAGEVLSETWALASSANTWITGNSTPLYDGISGALDEARQAVEQAEEAWKEAVNARDDAQDEAIKLLAEVQDLQTQQSVRMLVATSEDSSKSDGKVRLYKNGDHWSVEKIGDWVGSGVIHGTERSRITTEDRDRVTVDKGMQGFADFTGPNASYTSGARSDYTAIFYYTVQHGTAHNTQISISGRVMQSGEWERLAGYTNNNDKPVDVTVQYRLTWKAADRGVYYGMRATSGGTQIAYEYRDGLGPLLPLGNGVVSRTLNFTASLAPGADLEFFGTTSGKGDSQRALRDGSVKLVWIET